MALENTFWDVRSPLVFRVSYNATYSRMFATVDLHNLLRFLTLRTHPHAQLEIRVYAEAMRELARTIVPTCITVLDQTNQSAN